MIEFVDRLSGIRLDYTAAIADGLAANFDIPSLHEFKRLYEKGRYNYTTDSYLAMSIIKREFITVQPEFVDGKWSAYFRNQLFNEDGSDCFSLGQGPEEAALRCFIKAVYGDTVEVPSYFG